MAVKSTSGFLEEREFVVYCDESIKDGPFYSNFYGGVIVSGSQIHKVKAQLQATKAALNLHAEVKWNKVTKTYLPKYIALMDRFFDAMEQGFVRVRIMFRQNARQPVGLSTSQQEQAFYLLYYQFLKHAFGFAHMPIPTKPIYLRLYFDQFPDTGAQVERFKDFILRLNHSEDFRHRNLKIRSDQFGEVRSHDHVLMQCLDVVLGAMAWRLNDMHKQKDPVSGRRGSRTLAKEQLYKHLLARIQRIRPHFNIGISTGMKTLEERWSAPYRHWAFIPSESEYDETRTKGHQ